ncbi:MAG: hypothetical protein IKS55_01085 [Oscillospiraceae bacterium]|nr:hypothetical protein [Oscillospiraceae bacterium]
MEKKYPCPVCGTKCLSEEFGSFEICPVCGWEEDGYQQKNRTMIPDRMAIGR